jgi:hypothetical protein
METKQSGGEILPHSDLRGGLVFLEKASRARKRKRDISLVTWNVRSPYRAGSLRELARYKLDGSSGSGKGLWGLDGFGSG